MAGMLRHNSGSIISSLQNYGDSDEEDTEAKNDVLKVPFTNTEINPEDTNQSQSTSPDNAVGDAITFSAKPSDTQETEAEDKQSANSPASEKAESVPQKDDNNEEYQFKASAEVSPTELISDDEAEGSGRKEGKQTKPSLKEALKDAVASETIPDSPSSQGSASKPGRVAARLVSYGPDEDVDEEESSSSEEEDESPSNSPEATTPDNSSLSRNIRNLSSADIQIPPEPPGRCAAALQKKIEDSFDRMRREDYDLNRIIQSKKHFRNPSIYEKLIDFCHIDEKGTNFPPELYDPHIWGKESNYDELDKAQRKDMERREKEKKEKTKIEFLSGTKKSGGDSSSSGPSDEKRRKTKWDAQPPTNMNIHVSKLPSAQQNPGVVNLTATATGTKPTIIPAVGVLSKKSFSSSGK